MDDTGNVKEMEFKWLLSEQEIIAKQFSNYLEADQKIIAVMATVVVGIVGLSTAKIADIDRNAIPYVIFLASFLMSLAINQSSLYSSLILLCVERKYDLSARMGEILNCSPDIALTHESFADYRSIRSYTFGVAPYYAFKMVIGMLLSVSGLIYGWHTHRNFWLLASFFISFAFAALAAFVVLNNAVNQAEFQKYSKSTRKDEFRNKRKLRRTSQPSVDS